MAKKSARKSSPKKAATRKAPAAPVRRRTPAQAIKLAQAETGRVPVRTTARIFALNQAGALGITLSKPQLRRATDRVEKLFKERGIGGARPIADTDVPNAPAPAAPPLQAEQSEVQHRVDQAAFVARQEQLHREAVIGRPSPTRLNQGAGSIGSAPGNPSRRPLDQVIGRLDTTARSIEEAVEILINQLQPLLPTDFTGSTPQSPSAGYSSPLPNALDTISIRVESATTKLLALRDALAL